MKNLFILSLLCLNINISNTAYSQTIFQSDLSSWVNGLPSDWMGTASNISSSNVHEISAGVVFGTSYASLINTTASHKRFSTQPINVNPGETYKIEIWVSAYKGDLRTDYYNANNGTFGTYNPYEDLSISSGSTTVQTLVTQTITVDSSCTSAEFILSLRNTDPTGGASPWYLGILVDSVSISASSPPTPASASIYDIQHTNANSGDSPYANQQVSSGGIVNYVRYNGSFYLQSGAGPWTGIYVYDSTLNVSIGDSITFDADVYEYYNLTELKNISNLSIISSGNSILVNSASTNDANSESYEGCLIKTSNAECTNANGSFGEWTINDGSGPVQVDDFLFSYSPTQNALYDVTGLVDYNYGEFKILPRDADDVEQSTSIDELIEDIKIYPNPITNNKLNISSPTSSSIEIYNVFGQVVLSNKIETGENIIQLNHLSNGNYIIRINETSAIISKQ